MKPKQIKLLEKTILYVKWDNGEESKIGIQYLRDECPCANCKGETILFTTFRPPKMTIMQPDTYKIKEIKQVGGYAIQIFWADGHNTGFYTWEYLKKLADNPNPGEPQQYDKLI